MVPLHSATPSVEVPFSAIQSNEHGRAQVRDAIFYGYDWLGVNSTERIALAFARAGGTVLHCGAASSCLRRHDRNLRQIEDRLFTFKPAILGNRLNSFPGMRKIQAAAIVRQTLRRARDLGLKQPVFVYSGEGLFLLPVCDAMKARGYFLMHVCMDYWESGGREHADLPDLTLVIPETLFQKMRARWGAKVRNIPQAVDLRPYRNLNANAAPDASLLEAIPRPRLGYAGGAAHARLDTRLLADLLEKRPEWSFVSFGDRPAVSLPNAYVLPWQSRQGLAKYVAAFDVGFLPYPCADVVQFNGVPLKLFDYFVLGLPVVATPLIHLRENYEDLVYLGETAEELERAIEAALHEPSDSPKRQKRKDVAEAHSVEALARVLDEILK
jgi:hypothetical protein